MFKESEIHLNYIHSSGPGGQNVNKVATAVQLRVDVLHSPSLSDAARLRLIHLAGRRITAEGVLVIEAKRHRTQEQNREDALLRLNDLLRRAQAAPKTRRPSRPSLSSKVKRVESKKRRGQIKQSRRQVKQLD